MACWRTSAGALWQWLADLWSLSALGCATIDPMTAITQTNATVSPATKFAFYSAIEQAAKSAKETLKTKLVEDAKTTEATGFNSPFGKVSISQPKDSVTISNEEALVEYVERVLPTAVQTVKVVEEWARAAILDRLALQKGAVLVNGARIPDAVVVVDETEGTASAFTPGGEPIDGAVIADVFVDTMTDEVVTFAAVKPGGNWYPTYSSSPAKKSTVQAATEFLEAATPAMVESMKELTQ